MHEFSHFYIFIFGFYIFRFYFRGFRGQADLKASTLLKAHFLLFQSLTNIKIIKVKLKGENNMIIVHFT